MPEELELLLDELPLEELLLLLVLPELEDELDEVELLLELDELDDPELLSSSPCPPQAASKSATVTMVNLFMEIPGFSYARFSRFVMFPFGLKQPCPPNRQ